MNWLKRYITGQEPLPTEAWVVCEQGQPVAVYLSEAHLREELRRYRQARVHQVPLQVES
jgi:hypothetical protein